MSRVKLGARRQIILPAETVKRLGLKAGEEVVLIHYGGSWLGNGRVARSVR